MRRLAGRWRRERRLGQHRMMSRKSTHLSRVLRLLGLPLLAAALVWGALATIHAGSGRAAAGAPPSPCAALIDHVDLGGSFQGLAVERSRRCEQPSAAEIALPPDAKPPTSGINMELAVYGSCTPTADSGCAPPIQIQVWRACERNVSLYTRYPGPDGPVSFTRTTIRGVPAAIFDDGYRIELYTGNDTIVIFADTPARARAAAEALQGTVHGASRTAGEDLPAPAPGALSGTATC
jgi:hypothetical protein